MYILSVIPISRGIPFNTLSYYSQDSILAGSFVEIPFGKQIINGLVFDCQSLIEAKTNIKQATFSMKKIKGVLGISPFSKRLVSGLKESSSQTLTPIGSLAEIILNDLFFDFKDREIQETNLEILLPKVCYGSHSDRVDNYKRLIRTSFASKQSIVFVAPSIVSLESWYQILQKGILKHAVILHSKMTKKDQRSALSTIKNSDRPLLIFTTPSNALIPREDIKNIVLEDESSPLYKLHDRHLTDMKVVISTVSKNLNWQIFYGDILPSFETMIKAGSQNINKSFGLSKMTIVEVEKNRTLLPTEIIETIKFCKKNKKSLFIYTNRKGIAPISRCSDCFTVVDCPTCKLPMVLRYKNDIDGKKIRHFLCSYCGDTLKPEHTCSYCGSWNISPVSIGADALIDSVSDIVEKENIISFEDDNSLDNKDTQKIIDQIEKQKFFIMIGTQKLLPFIKGVDYVAIPFFDRILSTPSPFTFEDTLRLLYECDDKVKDTLIVCTSKPDFSITKMLRAKKIQEIIDEDIETRKLVKYPPFGTLIKLSVTLPPNQRETLNDKVRLFFDKNELTALAPRRISLTSMKILCVWIIQVENSFLEDYSEDLQMFLQDIRLPYSIEINPRRLS